MHRFLRSIGFSNILNRADMDRLLGMILNNPDDQKKTTRNGAAYTELRKEFAKNAGIVVRGEYDKNGFFHLEHYFPYVEDTHQSFHSTTEDVTVNHRVDTDAYTGMCDDVRLGVSLIFYLQNAVDYLKQNTPENTPHKARTSLSGLSLDGKILLGIDTNEDMIQRQQSRYHQHNKLISMARSGDQNAIDNLTIGDIDLSEQVARRIHHEDLYTLVESSFIPYGSESDNYSILGTIISWNTSINTISGEAMYQLLVLCNDINICVGINQKDLMGDPMIGRRFKGVIWMQGNVDFQNI